MNAHHDHTTSSRRAVLGALGAGALALTGCGGSGESSGKPTAKGSEKAPVVRAGKKVDGPTLKIWADSEFVPKMVAASKAFTENYKVNLEFQPLGFNDIQTQFLQAAPNGKGPDVIDAAIDWIPAFNKGGLLAPLDLGRKARDVDPRALKGMTADDTVYGLPVTVESINVWRNTEVVPEPVRTWEEMGTVAARLKAKGISFPFSMENDPTNAYLFIGMLTAFGGYCFKQRADGTYDVNDVGLDNEGSIAALTWLRDARRKGWTKAGITADVATKSFTDDKAGVELGGPWRLDGYQDASYAIDPLPSGPGGPARPFLGCRGFMVNKLSEQLTLAQTFLTEFWATDAPMQSFADATGKESAWAPVKKQQSGKDLKAFIAASKDAQIIPTEPALAEYWPSVGKAMQLVLESDKTDPAAAMRSAAAQVRKAAKKG